MNNCKNCEKETAPGQPICDSCVNNWSIMRGIIQKRLTDQYGPATRENLTAHTQEMNRLENTWKRDRDAFKREIAQNWYAKTPTT
jgi:hypothetical protein